METVAQAGVAAELHPLADQLEQHRGFAEVLASLSAGHGGTLGGVWGSSCALVAAAIERQSPQSLVVVLPHTRDIDSFCDDVALFTSARVEQLPAWETDAGERVLNDDIYGGRLRILKSLISQKDNSLDPTDRRPRIIVTAIQSLMQPVPSEAAIAAATRQLAVGDTVDTAELTRWLAAEGCASTSAVEMPGEFSLRGGILDLFPPDAEHPIRLELFGDEVESLRTFDVANQRSLSSLDTVDVTVLQPTNTNRTHFTGYLPAQSWFMLVEPSELQEEGRFYHERLERPEDFFSVSLTLSEINKFPSVTASGVPVGSYETTAHMQFESIERFSGDVHRVREELDAVATDHRVILVTETDAEVERLSELFAETRLMQDGKLRFVPGRLARGFRFVAEQVVLISASELFHREEIARPAQRQTGRAIDSFLQLREGDLVVHLSHGIGRYRGLKLLEKEAGAEEHLEVEFHGGTKIYVPTSRIELVQKYVGGRQAKPRLATIGGRSWIRQKQAAEKAVTDFASEMLELEAARNGRPGIVFPTDTVWQREFDTAFPYQETPDQLSAIAAIKSDMQIAKPMDRLLCGDVGFGKTEMAMRAAFKAIDAGYQVAVLVPTTVLAEQHCRTFRQRMAEYPFEIASLSRFCTAKQSREILARTANGSIDLLIGTHRLVSPDVQFQNLGLVIIDEEQRFGVTVKERLKALRASVDVLTMTATPIPRTLHMSLLGARSISNLETAPKDRLAVETRIARFDESLIRHAILRELNRGGQVFFVHNRVHDIQNVARKLQEIVPEASIGIGHGQMTEHELEDAMLGFVSGQYDILLATTIIESGLDIPNSNTIFIDDADRYGLADLHQLRGRVGRYKHRAYCYLLVDENRHLSPEAARRLRAIEEFSQMGAGFALAMRDLEIRGAGNLLGTQQSGHIATVGYELYCALLEKAVRELKQLPPRDSVDVIVDLPIAAYFPRQYVPDMRTKIDLYRRLSRVTQETEVAEFRAELVDRFGALPAPVEQLVQLARLRIWAHQWQVGSIHLENPYLVLGYRDSRQLGLLIARSGEQLRRADDQSAYLPLGNHVEDPAWIMAELESLLRRSESDH
ncbi:transcription-repair coupling factor [Bythopirellula polymerisocia]|uniref:Transcription-repair-coupling factor n=1 Tax=Bythopirellula polymerisocia TaxID=2528003 RepID=A0A5C6CXN1_9BACT|nr:transcription-repair coupling factor [Bythopirellula polymerisocia]TWU29713.1 Transcription-repair-coupling factor [Bythopirellula polymerisocia]